MLDRRFQVNDGRLTAMANVADDDGGRSSVRRLGDLSLIMPSRHDDRSEI